MGYQEEGGSYHVCSRGVWQLFSISHPIEGYRSEAVGRAWVPPFSIADVRVAASLLIDVHCPNYGI